MNSRVGCRDDRVRAALVQSIISIYSRLHRLLALMDLTMTIQSS